jgi:hypothetical protein
MSVNSPQFKYGVPDSNPGSAFASQTSTPENTSNIFYGDSKEKATRWTVQRNQQTNPNAAYAGKGAITFDNPASSAQQPGA